MNLSDVPVLSLLVELLYEGKSRLIPELESFEPIDVNVLCDELKARYGHSSAAITPNEWLAWSLQSGDLSEGDRNTLAELVSFKQKQDDFIRHFRK